MVLPIEAYIIVAALGTIVYLVILLRRGIAAGSDSICGLSPTTKAVLIIMLLIAVVRGGGKITNQVDQTSVTNAENQVEGLQNGEATSSSLVLNGRFRFYTSGEDAASPLPVTDEDLAFGWQRLGPFTNANVVYAMPDGATLASNWWLRGAYEDVKRIGLGGLAGLAGLKGYDSMWAFTWGKVRFALGDTNEIVAVGAPMSAVPQFSRLWSAADTNGAFRLTWENFALGRIEESRLCPSGETPLPLCCAQIEFRANGDYVTRSNEVETVWRRIDPNDFDGDGYLNGDDPNPFEWDDGAGTYYGPYNDLPWYCNEDAYCDVTVMIDSTRSEWVTFAGDGYSDYSDPYFLAKPGVPYDVKILIGKTYRVTCDAPVRAVSKSDPDIEIRDVATNAFTVVWPVTISEAPRLFAAPLPGLLGGSHGNTGFFLDVNPPWLDGIFGWTTNTCCHVADNNGWWEFACEDDCQCGGCEIGGSYTYEGYTVFFSGINCGCHYEPHDNTTFGLTAPSAVFKDGTLRPLGITFHHGDIYDPEEGELTLEVIRGGDKIRLWEDADRTYEATSPWWSVTGFDGCTLYIEGLEKSRQADDIKFRLTWTRPGGGSSHADATTTCAEVLRTEVTSLTAGITDGSPNQQPFTGHTNWDFDVTHSPRPDKHFAVLFRDVVNPDFSVRDFSLRMTLVVDPADAPVGTASWFALEPTPQSGSIVSTNPRIGSLVNPKVGGVYHIGSCFAGSPTNECNIVLPLAGASMDFILQSDLRRADNFASAAIQKYDVRERNSRWFGAKWFVLFNNGDYIGRPNSALRPTVWAYNQVSDLSGFGAVCTLSGIPIRLAKLSNLVAGYACEKIGVIQKNQDIAQGIGTTNSISAQASWDCGNALAHGAAFNQAISNTVRIAWTENDDKTTKLWPNPSAATNRSIELTYDDFDHEFYSPGFLFKIP